MPVKEAYILTDRPGEHVTIRRGGVEVPPARGVLDLCDYMDFGNPGLATDQTAVTILADAYGPEAARKYYVHFREAFLMPFLGMLDPAENLLARIDPHKMSDWAFRLGIEQA